MVQLVLTYGLIIVLYCLIFIAVYPFLEIMHKKWGKRKRLWQHYRSFWVVKLFDRIEKRLKESLQLSQMLESIRWNLNASQFIGLSLLLGSSGVIAGVIYFLSIKGALSIGIILGWTPWIVMRMKLISLHMKTRMEFLPAVELFYQFYVMKEPKNIRLIFQEMEQSNRLRYPIRSVFEQLSFNLSTQRNVEESLNILSLSLGHNWATYFTQIVAVGMDEGVDMTESLRQLITDMRKSQRSDQQDRNRLLEIRIANFSPIIFLIVFIGINFKLNNEQAYYYYILNPEGKQMLLDAFILIFLSFVMGLLLSLKRM